MCKSMSGMEFVIRTMREEDLPFVIEMRRRQNEYLNAPFQIQAWFRLFPDMFKVAVSTDGILLGTCAAVKEHDKLYHIGMYSVHENYQRMGIGMKLWNAVWETIGDSDVVLTARSPMIPKYLPAFPLVEKNFFRVCYGTDAPVNAGCLNSNCPSDVRIEIFNQSHLSAICDYDHRLFGYKRGRVLKLNCTERSNCTFVAMKGNLCVGFGTVRIGCRRHALIGPLYCDNSKIAEPILKKLLQSFPSTTGLMMTTSNTNTSAIKLMNKLGCPKVDEAAIMYTRELAREKITKINTNKIFSIFCLNFAVL